VLGRGTRNQITDLFEKPVILGVRGAAGPFVFVWDEDVAECIARGVCEGWSGIFNLAGDGALALQEIAGRLGRRYLALPAWLLGGALFAVRALGLSTRGPEQVDFLRHRPVLSNERLRRELGFTPLSSEACFARYAAARSRQARG
jgi:UDP-glucose 4-epimerase